MKKELKMEIEKEEKNKQCVGVDFYLTQQYLDKKISYKTGIEKVIKISKV